LVGEVGQAADAGGRDVERVDRQFALRGAMDDQRVNVAGDAEAEERPFLGGREVVREHDVARARGPGAAELEQQSQREADVLTISVDRVIAMAATEGLDGQGDRAAGATVQERANARAARDGGGEHVGRQGVAQHVVVAPGLLHAGLRLGWVRGDDEQDARPRAMRWPAGG
jgi:hypothetical protein